MFSREALLEQGAVSVSVIDIFGIVRHGFWIPFLCENNEALTDSGINDYIISNVALVVMDNGYLYSRKLVDSGIF